MHPLSRREFLRAGGSVALGALAIACGGERRPSGPRTLDDVIAGRSPNMQVVAPFEVFSNRPERLAFGLTDPGTGARLNGGEIILWAARGREEEAMGPFSAVYRGEGLGDRGIYTAEVTFPAAGQWLLAAEGRPAGASSDRFGVGVLKVGAQTQMPKPGDLAVSVATPTVERPRGVDPICTLEPPCSMHEVSLDDALDANTPAVMIVATPKYCQSALCGPEVQILDAIAKETPDEIAFVHVELLANDDPKTVERFFPLSPAATKWQITQEPAIYFIDSSGVIVQRIIGPFDRTEARASVERLATPSPPSS